MFNDYKKLLLEDASIEAIAKERKFISSETNVDFPLDEGYNQWIEFDINYNFPLRQYLILQESDVKIDCGKLYHLSDKDSEIKNYPLVVFPSPSTGSIGACGHYCAGVGTMGRIVLREYNDETKIIGEDVLSIQWRSLYKSYKYNFFYACTFNPKYVVIFNHDYPKDRAMGRQKVTITHR